ncbi:MAG: N-acetyltransferase [Sphingomonadaceae bacterium]|nr:N-acetyltransferase [Sphingomonadaceae bacterium]
MPLALRIATLDDAHAIAAIYGPYVVSSAASFEDVAPSGKEMVRRIAGSIEHFPWIVAEMDGVVLGYASASKFRERAAYRWTVETSVYVSHDMRGQGIGRALYRALLGTLEEQGFVQAIAAIALPNDQSIDLHEAVGFQRAGHYREVGYKRDQWHDVGIWQRELMTPDDPPEEPKSFSEVGLVLQ